MSQKHVTSPTGDCTLWISRSVLVCSDAPSSALLQLWRTIEIPCMVHPCTSHEWWSLHPSISHVPHSDSNRHDFPACDKLRYNLHPLVSLTIWPLSLTVFCKNVLHFLVRWLDSVWIRQLLLCFDLILSPSVTAAWCVDFCFLVSLLNDGESFLTCCYSCINLSVCFLSCFRNLRSFSNLLEPSLLPL